MNPATAKAIPPATIKRDMQHLAAIFPDPILTEPRGVLDEAREPGAIWAREHVRLRGTVPDVLRQALAVD